MYHELQRFLGTSFSIKKCSSTEFNEYITNIFSSDNVQSDISEELSDSFDLESFAGSISATEDLLSGNNDAPIIKLINGIISKAIKLRASDIHFEPYEDQIIVRYRVDGILKEVLTQDSKISSVLISRLKIMSGLDI
jgi:general secretion pathway protein E